MNFDFAIFSGLFAAGIAAVISIVLGIINSRDIKRVEASKKNFEVQKYRYQKLHEYLEQIGDIPLAGYDRNNPNHHGQLYDSSTKRSHKINAISRAVIPILDKDFQGSVEEAFGKEAKTSHENEQLIYDRKDKEVNLQLIFDLRQDCERELISAAQKQLERLLIS